MTTYYAVPQSPPRCANCDGQSWVRRADRGTWYDDAMKGTCILPRWVPAYARWDDYPLSEAKTKGTSVKLCPKCNGSGENGAKNG
jgi:hypothetical protein